MGKKSRQKRAPERHERSSATAVAQSARPTQSRFKHRWLARLIAAVVVPLLLVGLIEGGLRLCRYGYSTRFFIPAEDGKSVAANPRFAWQYYPKKTATSPTPMIFAKQKAAGTKRIFILGESAAAGTPDPAFGFWRMLDLMLREQYPNHRFEIINAAMRGIDSHIIRTIAAECAELSPDLFIVYAGNNDMIGLHSPSPNEHRWIKSIHWLRFKHAVHRLKLMQFGSALLARFAKDGPKQDMEFFRQHRLAFDDPRRDRVYEHYGINLRDVCRLAEDAGARTMLCSVAVNLRDFPPLASLHRPGLGSEQLAQWQKLYAEGSAAESARNYAGALASFEEAARIDDRYAELLFRIARCHDALGKHDEAKRYFAMARDWDAIQFRTDSRMNSMVRTVATNAPGRVHFMDLEQEFARSPLAERGLPGQRLFQEHVHFTFEGDHQVASVLLPVVASAFQLPAASKPVLSRDDCARALAYTMIDDLNVRMAVNRLTGNPPFQDQLDHAVRQLKADHESQERLKKVTQRESEEALAIYRAALAARPDDWMLRVNMAALLSQLNQPGAAVPFYAEVVKRLPHEQRFRVALGQALMQSGQARQAREHFEAALRLDPELKPARDGLALVTAKQ
jgi:tetratricopeptide (TPR) repeat protein